jgi:FixJ family two-component response regulator
MLFCGFAENAGCASRAMQSHADRPDQRPVIAVVDDDRAVRNSLRFALEIEGFSVWTYSDGNELLNDTDLGASSCLVVDQKLPGTNGLQTIAKLRERRISVPAILITSHPSALLMERAAKAGIPIVEKPFIEDELIDRIRDAIGQRGRQA